MTIRTLPARLVVACCLLGILPSAVVAQNQLELETVFAEVGQQLVALDVKLTHDIQGGLAGFSFGLTHDAGDLSGVSLEHSLGLLIPDFEASQIGVGYMTIGVVYALSPALPTLAEGSYEVARATYNVTLFASLGLSPVSIALAGQPPIALIFSPGPITPTTVDGGVLIVDEAPPGTIVNLLWFPSIGDELVTIIDPTDLSSTPASVGGQSDPRGIAIAPNGMGWVAYAGTGTVARVQPDGNQFGSAITTGMAPTGVCVDHLGNTWVTDATDGTVTKIAPSGAVLLGMGGGIDDAILVGNQPTGIAADAIGNIWVAIAGDDQLKKLNNNGELAVVVDLQPGDEPHGVAIDRKGFIWVTLRGADLVQRRGSGGSLVQQFTGLPVGAAPEGIVIRGVNEAWIAAELPYHVVPGGALDPIDAPGTPDPTGILIDGLGDVWVTDASGTATRFDADETLIETTAIGIDPGLLGDASGMIQANILRPNGDFDSDGFSNRFEVDAATNPFDAVSNPGIVPQVIDLSCFVVGQDVELSWTNPLTFDAIQVLRDAQPLATLPGDATSFVDPVVSVGNYAYEIFGEFGGQPADAVGCAVIVGQGGVEDENTIGVDVGDRATNLFDVSTNENAGPGEPRFYATDSGSGKIYALDEDFSVLGIIDSPFQGIVPSTGIAYRPDGNGGAGSLFIASGGDGSDPSQIAETTLGGVVIDPPNGAGLISVIGTLGPLSGPIGGIDYEPSGGSIVGIEPGGCAIFALSPAQSALVDFEFVHPDPGPGLNGIEFLGGSILSEFQLLLTAFDPVDESYSIDLVDVTNNGGVITAVPAGSSIPLTALQAEENVFGGFSFFDGRISLVGTTTSVVYEIVARRPFIRGDANLDLALNVADAVTILDYLFNSGTDYNCLDAFDTNDDGGNNIADAIWLLDYLFNGGMEPPPPGCNAQGVCEPGLVDPTLDGLFCL